jgi:hypothetical protein
MIGDEMHVVLRQSEFDHWQRLEAEIDAVETFDDLLERPVSEIKPVTVTPAIPEIDRGVDQRPVIIPAGNRWQGGLDIDVLFGR